MEEVIAKLNEVLSWELAGTIQYLHHSALVTGPERVTFAEFFHDGSKEARGHAEAVANKITALGGVPTVEPAKIRTATTLDEMLLATLALEQDALAAWEAAYDACEGVTNRGTIFWIEECIAEEQEHVDEMLKLTTKARAAAGEDADAASQAG